jgi:hypothetical protein
MQIGVRITGVDNLLEVLKKLPPAIEQKVLAAALSVPARKMAKAARGFIESATRGKGTLAKSIDFSTRHIASRGLVMSLVGPKRGASAIKESGQKVNATRYAQVYEWMHHHEVTDWTYTTLLPLNGTDTRCAVVSYKTFVQSPTFFARLLSNFHMLLQFPIEVHKTVCVIGEAVVEDATITVPLLHELTMAARYEPQDGQINSTIDAQYTLPWYIDFLVSDVSDHLRSNFKEKVDAVAHTLCSHTPSVASLSSPDHAYAYLRGHGDHGSHGKTGKGDHGLPPPRHGHGNGRDHRIPHRPHRPPP